MTHNRTLDAVATQHLFRTGLGFPHGRGADEHEVVAVFLVLDLEGFAAAFHHVLLGGVPGKLDQHSVVGFSLWLGEFLPLGLGDEELDEELELLHIGYAYTNEMKEK